MEEKQIVKILYTNWKGETAYRNIIPKNIEFKSTEWHKQVNRVAQTRTMDFKCI